MKVLNLIGKSYAEVVKFYGKNIHESVKKEKETLVDFTKKSQTAKVTATVYNKYLVKTEKTLKLWQKKETEFKTNSKQFQASTEDLD